MGAEVENQYRLALEDGLPSVRSYANQCGTVYYEVQRALDNGAWESTTADTFSSELGDKRRSSEDAGDAAETAFENKYNNEPEKVPEDDDRAHWSAYQPPSGPGYYYE